MKKAHLSPFSSHSYNFGNNEVQMPYLDVLLQMESKGNVEGEAFCMEPKILNNDNQIRDGAFGIPYQSHFNSNFLPDYQYGSSNFDHNFQQPMSLGSKLAIPHFESGNTHNFQNGRKHEINDDPINGVDERNKKKRKKLSSFEQQLSHQTIEELAEIKDFRLDMPVRRSQKLSDKITTLQKLVSPYGKTDTASVLQEASIYIKLLQEQIQMLSSSYKSPRAIHPQEIGKKQQDLRSRGLCLVPISFSQSATKEEQSSLENSNNM
ncbi:transcription factor bHLH111-like isoform X2 [Hibiscus syriacus]|uniref:transcription factor bHLH111-like isoform X2 n=1 Tax=Hibiscus syriacus TaxID=106335 RepID=UPI001924AD59|nr:transcription factor bHLH111-like isoform X2 [Hibiscus syriacus]